MKKSVFFKRIVSAAILSAMLLSSAVACAKVDDNTTMIENIGVASTDAEQYAKWLSERLGGEITDDVVIGIGDSKFYDVDMSAFEDDGYVIKKHEGKIAIFGKTADGLDRGVRKYANAVDEGKAVEETTYHKGARIEKLTLFGTDISEFTIVYAEDHNDNMKFASEELCQLLKKATGKELPIKVGNSDAAHKIELRHSDDEALKEDGYVYFEENGNLVIEGAVARGCSNGVYRFLDNELGWECLMYGDSYLPEADLIEVPAGLSKTETPIMDYLYVHTNAWNQYVTDRTEVAWNAVEMSYGPFGQASHGTSRFPWSPSGYTTLHTTQMCYSKESVFDFAYDQIVDYIEDNKKAGAEIGVTLKDIDVSQGDNNRYCTCKTCTEIMSYDKSTAGPVLQFANKVAERLIEDGYENMAVHIFGYFSTKKPPEVTKAHPNVHITYCLSLACFNHSLYGEECESHEQADRYPKCAHVNLEFESNADLDRWLSKWCEIADNVLVWYYALDTCLHQYSILDVMLEDFRYLNEKGIRGMFWQITHHGFGVKRVEQQLGVEINWHKDMTDEEYEAEICKLLEREYGPGWEYVREYLDHMIEAKNRLGCATCWGWGSNNDAEYDFKYMQETYKTQIELIEKAIKMAGSADEEYRCKLLSCSIYYSSAFSQYFEAYENEDAEKLAELNELYDTAYNRVVELGFNPEEISTVDSFKIKVYPTLEKEAWMVWYENRAAHVGTEELRPEPDWVSEARAELTAEVEAEA